MINYEEHSDQELTSLLKEGDIAAFDEIYRRYAEPLYKFAWTILKDEAECTDVIQDIFVWLWENRSRAKISFIKSYLFAAVKLNLADHIRKSNRRAEIVAHAPKQDEIFEEYELELKELKFLIREFVAALPERAREIFELSRNQYLSNKQIAEKLGISEKTVENQMTIILKKLRVNLGKNAFWSVFL